MGVLLQILYSIGQTMQAIIRLFEIESVFSNLSSVFGHWTSDLPYLPNK